MENIQKNITVTENISVEIAPEQNIVVNNHNVKIEVTDEALQNFIKSLDISSYILDSLTRHVTKTVKKAVKDGKPQDSYELGSLPAPVDASAYTAVFSKYGVPESKRNSARRAIDGAKFETCYQYLFPMFPELDEVPTKSEMLRSGIRSMYKQNDPPEWAKAAQEIFQVFVQDLDEDKIVAYFISNKDLKANSDKFAPYPELPEKFQKREATE